MSKTKNTSETKAVTTVKEKPYNWTEKRKADAHKRLLVMFNRVEIQKRNSLNVEYLPDGTAISKTLGRVAKNVKIKM